MVEGESGRGQKPIRWSKGGMIMFSDGVARSVSPTGRTIALGSEKEVEEALAERKRTGNPVIDGILLMELASRGAPEISKGKVVLRRKRRRK